MDAFTKATRDVMELQNGTLAVLVAGGTGLDRIDLALKRARQKRDETKKMYLAHLQQHGC